MDGDRTLQVKRHLPKTSSELQSLRYNLHIYVNDLNPQSLYFYVRCYWICMNVLFLAGSSMGFIFYPHFNKLSVRTVFQWSSVLLLLLLFLTGGIYIFRYVYFWTFRSSPSAFSSSPFRFFPSPSSARAQCWCASWRRLGWVSGFCPTLNGDIP